MNNKPNEWEQGVINGAVEYSIMEWRSLDRSTKTVVKTYKEAKELFKKTIYSFKRWNISTTEGNSITAWCIIFTDKSHELVPTTKIKELIFHGHVRKDMEKYHNIDQEIRERHAKPENPALFHGEKRQSLTTDEEKKELNEFRTKVISDIK